MGVGGSRPSKGPSLRVRKLGIALFGVFALVGVVVGALAMTAKFSAPKPAKSMQSIDRETTSDVVPVPSVIPEPSEKTPSGMVSPELGGAPVAAPASSGYGGRPVISGLTEIYLEGRIRASTLSGQVPMPVHVNALSVGWAGPTKGNPYEDLEYTWEFGDPGALRTYLNPTTGITGSSNTGQVGPEALHVYDTPGTYTIKCTARGWNGEAFVTATTTTVVKVACVRVQTFMPATAPAGTYTLRVQRARHARAARVNFFSGTYLHRPAGHSLAPGAAGFFFQGWFKQREPGYNGCLASYWANANGKRSWKIIVNTAGVISLYVGDSAGGIYGASTGAIYKDQNWHYVEAWCNVATGEVKLVVDGTEASSLGPKPANVALPSPGDVPFGLGVEFAGNLTPGNIGMLDIDEVGLWNRPPTGAERAWLYNGGSGRHWDDVSAGVTGMPSGLTAGLKAWWSLDESNGPAWSDSSGNGQALQDFGLAGQIPGVKGVIPKVWRSGGVETAPLAHDATIHAVKAAILAAQGWPDQDVTAVWQREIQFSGSQSGIPWTLAPGTLSSDFNGTLAILGDDDGEPGPSVVATAWNTARSPEVYFDSNAPSGGTGTAVAPYNSAADLFTAINGTNFGKKILLKAGSDFTIPSAFTFWPRSPFLIQKWGSGADPILRDTTQYGHGMFSVRSDAVLGLEGFFLDRVRIVTPAGCFGCSIGNATNTLSPKQRNIYLLDVNMEGAYFIGGRVGMGSPYVNNVGVIGGSISGGGGVPAGYPGTGSDRAQNMGFDHASFGAVFGASISGGGTTAGINGNIYAHHIYWSAYGHGTLARWINFGAPAPLPAPLPSGQTHHELGFCLKGSAFTSDLVGTERQGFVLDSCVLTGTANPGAFGRLHSALPVGTGYAKVVVSKCRIYRSANPGGQELGHYIADASSATYRDNTNWNNGGFQINPTTANYLCDAKFYRNRILVNTGSSWRNLGITVSNAAGLEITDNVIQVLGTSPTSGYSQRGAIYVGSFDWKTTLPGVVIARNRYHFPGLSKPFLEAWVGKTLLQWQANGWDLDAVVADPGWVDAANGNFATAGEAQVATSYTLSGPTALGAGAAGTYTLTANGVTTGVGVTVNITGSAPRTFALTGSIPVTFQYTAASAGTVIMSATNNGGLADPAALTVVATQPAVAAATAYTLTGPTAIKAGVAGTYTIAPNGPAANVGVTVAITGSSPRVLTLNGTAPVTFQHTATSAGAVTISVTNSGGLTNPAPLVVAVAGNVAPKSNANRPPRITPSQLSRPNTAKWRRSGRYP